MTASGRINKLPGTFRLLQQTAQLYFSHWDIFLGYAGWLLLPLIVSLASFLAFSPETAELIHAGLSQLLLVLLVSWLYILTIRLVPLLQEKSPIPFHRIGKEAALLLIPYLITSIVVEFFTLTGLFALIIPGMYLGTVLFFAPILTVRNGLSLIDSLKSSINLTRYRVLPTFLRLVSGAVILSFLALMAFFSVEVLRTMIAGGGLQNIFLSPPSLVTEVIYQGLLIFFLPAFMIYHMLLFLALEKTEELPKNDLKKA